MCGTFMWRVATSCCAKSTTGVKHSNPLASYVLYDELLNKATKKLSGGRLL